MRSISLAAWTVGGVAALALAACAPMSQQQTGVAAAGDQRQQTEVAGEAPGGQAMQRMLEQIRADAAQRAGVTTDKVQILAVQSVTWADGALGCPEPGMMYTQALVRGHRIEVDAAGTTLLYHAGPQNRFVHCPPERAQAPSAVDPT